MSHFTCEHCGELLVDTPRGYVTGCEHYPADVKMEQTYVGRIVAVDGEWACVELEAEDGQRFTGRRLMADFARLGIEEGGYFSCKTINDPGYTRTEIGPPILHEIDESLIKEMQQEVHNMQTPTPCYLCGQIVPLATLTALPGVGTRLGCEGCVGLLTTNGETND